MARKPKSLADSIAADKERLRVLQERIAGKEARLKKTSRAVDTRRKVLLGAWVLDAIEKGKTDGPWAAVRAHLADFRGFAGERNEGVFPPEFYEGRYGESAAEAAD